MEVLCSREPSLPQESCCAVLSGPELGAQGKLILCQRLEVQLEDLNI